MRLRCHLLLLVACFLFCSRVWAQLVSVPSNMPNYHPRLLIHDAVGKKQLQEQIAMHAQSKKSYDDIENALKPILDRVEQDSTWLYSRLQMYWKSCHTDVNIKNGVFQNSFGKAPVPTVRFSGARDAVTNYSRPKLVDVKPFMDNEGKIYLQNKSIADKPWEWVDPSKTGRVIEAINIEIIEIARDAAFMYWFTGNEKYAKLAFKVLDTYMTGMYYRNEPIDLNNGHDQTLVGLHSFEVIHEDILLPLTAAYDFLHGYIQKAASHKLSTYKSVFTKWADIIIKNGVPSNNWNLIEAHFIAHIALVLENDASYADGKGAQYYLNRILNISSSHQWSLKELMHFGFDEKTGIWNESPGYSQNVVADFTDFIMLFQRVLNIDLAPAFPLVTKAVTALPQYLFPNGYIVAFGDTHYGRLRISSIKDLINNAQHFGKKEVEKLLTSELKWLQTFNKGTVDVHTSGSVGGPLNKLLESKEIELNDSVKAALPNAFISPTFYAPNVSWLVQRNGLNPNSALMISQAGSLGNHAHANGIAMELYGKGVVIAPEGGRGTSYASGDYAEYYSQFPAHNTVCVDGISSYPAMKSNHPFEVKGIYPPSNQQQYFFPLVTYSNVFFTEPETNASQQRVMGIVRTSDSTGYYVDVFRSKRNDRQDKFHDYIYHNIGQEVKLMDGNNRLLPLKSAERPSFAEVSLMGYDYWYDKKSVITDQDFKASFLLGLPNRDSIVTHMWMKGDKNREIFSVKAPKSMAYGRDNMLPKNIAELPLPTIVVRQNGEAWTKPFAAVYEPTHASTPDAKSVSSIQSFKPLGTDENFVGLTINNKNGDVQHIFSSATARTVQFENSKVNAHYAMVSKHKQALQYLFLGEGTLITHANWSVATQESANAILHIADDNKVFFSSNKAAKLCMPASYFKNKAAVLKFEYEGKKLMIVGRKIGNTEKLMYEFKLPPVHYSAIEFN